MRALSDQGGHGRGTNVIQGQAGLPVSSTVVLHGYTWDQVDEMYVCVFPQV